MAMKNTIKIEEETKDKLDKLGAKGETYNEIIEKHLFAGFNFENKQMPIPVRISTKGSGNIEPFIEGWVICDTGGTFYLFKFSRTAGGVYAPSPIKIMMSKDVIAELEVLEEIPFKLTSSHLLGIRDAERTRPEQWQKNKLPKLVEMNEQNKTEFLRKINKIEIGEE